MRKKLLATLRGLSAVVLMLFATNFLPVASALVGSASAASTDITWGQQGRDKANPNCLEGQTAKFHFVLAPAGTTINDAGTINVTFSPSGSDSDVGIIHANGAGSYNVSGDYNSVASSATVTGADWTASAKHPDRQPLLVLSSSSCSGTPTTQTTPTVTAEVQTCSEEDATTDVVVSVTNNASTSAMYTVAVAGANSQTVTITAGDTSSVTFTGLSVGPHTATVSATDQNTQTANFTVTSCEAPETPEPAKPTVTAEATACVEGESDNGSVTVTVTNTADETKTAVTYTVTLAGMQESTGSIADGSSKAVTFTGLSAGKYDVTVTGSDDTTASKTVKVKQCKKVFVCKFVGTPGVDERLKDGKNPISVSISSIKDFQGVGTSYFNDAHERSFVLAFDAGQPTPDVSLCVPQGPTVVGVPSPPTITDLCGTGNATWNVPANTDQVKYILGSDGHLRVHTIFGFVFSDGSHSHDYGVAVETNTSTCGTVLGDTDVCPNITGDQATVPAGMTKDKVTGNCITTVVTGGQGGDVLGASTLANTGESPWAAIIVGVTVISLTLTSAFASRRMRLDA